jgi:DNA-binding response OmpR family regulator
MQATIVVVEDEDHLREGVAEYLGERGFRVLTAANATAFREIARDEMLHVVILDITMPGEDGLSLARWLRQWPHRPGIIFATASGTSIDRIVGLEIGADDYVVKPYDLRELLARIRSLLRRLPPTPVTSAPQATEAAPRVVRIGPYAINLDARRLTGPAGQTIELTASEFDLLETLVARPNRVFTRAQLLAGGHDRSGDESERSVDIRITRLRRKIEADPQQPTLIQTVRGEGYMLVTPS